MSKFMNQNELIVSVVACYVNLNSSTIRLYLYYFEMYS